MTLRRYTDRGHAVRPGRGIGFAARPVGLAVSLAATLAACATVAPGSDTAAIDRLLTDRGAVTPGWTRDRTASEDATVKTWLSEPMSVDRAVQVAMLKSPRLLQHYGELGLAHADVLAAVQIANPRLSLSRLSVQGGPGVQTGYGLAMPLADLLVLPARTRLARLENEGARFRIAAAIQDVSLDVEAAWHRAVAAQQVAEMRRAVDEARQISAALAERYFNAGNISELQLSREQAAASQARISASQARVDAKMARLDLNTLIGLSGDEATWTLPATLPLPVTQEDDVAALQKLASDSNLGLLAARQDLRINDSLAKATRATRLLGDTAVGYGREREADRSRIRGPTLDLELPLFNQGQARVAGADARLALAQGRLRAIELGSGNAISAGVERVKVLSEIVAIHRDALVPQRERVVARSQEAQNFMLIGIFEVIEARTQTYDAYESYLNAIADYWVARVDLKRLVGARLPSEAQSTGTTPDLSTILGRPEETGVRKPEPAPASHDHHGARP